MNRRPLDARTNDHSDSPVNRRTFVLGASTAMLAGLAGCLGDDGDDSGDGDDTQEVDLSGDDGTGDDETGNGDDTGGADEDPDPEFGDTESPAYALWFDAAVEEHSVLRTDFTRVTEVDPYNRLLEDRDGEGVADVFPGVDSIAEAIPATTSFTGLILLGAVGQQYPFLTDLALYGRDVDEDSTPTVTIEELTLVDGDIVITGDIDRDALEANDTVEYIESHAGFLIYEDGPDGAPRSPFAVGDDTLVFPGGDPDEDRQARLKSTLDGASAGVDVGDDLAWLVEHCGDGAFVFGGAGGEVTDDEEEEELDGELVPGVDNETVEAFEELVGEPEGILLVADGHESGRVTRSGIAFESAEAVPDEDELAAVLAAGAAETSTLTEGNRIFVEAVWTA